VHLQHFSLGNVMHINNNAIRIGITQQIGGNTLYPMPGAVGMLVPESYMAQFPWN